MPRRSIGLPAPLLIDRNDPRYPAALATHLAAQAQPAITVRGNLDLLWRPTLALFCSAACPGNLVLRTYDLMRTLRDRPPTLLSGFHTPMEQECLDLLLRGTAPLVVCPARAVEGMRVPAAWQNALDAGRLALLSPFTDEQRRVTADLAWRRNLFVAALADAVFIVHAAPGGRPRSSPRPSAPGVSPSTRWRAPTTPTSWRWARGPSTHMLHLHLALNN